MCADFFYIMCKGNAMELIIKIHRINKKIPE